MTWSGLGRLFLYAAIGVIAGCSRPAVPRLSVQPETKPAPPTPIAEKKEELGKPSWNPKWDLIVEKALPPEMLSSRVARAVKPFCPRFNALSEVDKRAYWAYLFQALAGAEAGLVPTTDVRHTESEVAVKDAVSKRMVRSEGLLQLTYMDAERYGCDFDWEKDKELPEKDPSKTILQPTNNLTCGVKIMENQLIARRKPLVSRSSYWSTLQPGTISYRVFVKQMVNVPEVCRVASLARQNAKGTDRISSASSLDGDTSAAAAR
ncbi:MAG: hypothetical protein ABSE51_12325 [Terracidiphilus sp.]